MVTMSDTTPPTREEIEAVLRDYDFEPSAGSPHVWQNAERTKFLAFPEGEVPAGKEATAIYGDAELGEPGRALSFVQAKAVVRGQLELNSPALAKLSLPAAPRSRELPAATVVQDGELEPEDA